MKKITLLFVFLTYFFISFSQSYRDSIDVKHYDIHLTVNLPDKSIKGYTTLNLSTIYSSDIVKIDLLGLKVADVKVNKKKFYWSYNDTTITIRFKKNLPANSNLDITVFYEGHPQQDKYWGGFYFKWRDAFNLGVGMTSVPHSFGRVWFPCNDKFDDKATFDYFITVNKKYSVACGGMPIDTVFDKNRTTFHWKQNLQIPTYLASVNVAEYDTIKDVVNLDGRQVPILIFAFKNQKENTKASLEHLKDAVSIFDSLFGAYQWERIGYSATSFDGGAMEHAENIAMSQIAFDGSLKNETLLYHELSHSWFGNLVTCKTAGDMWLNEGWATYSEALFLENMYGKQRFRDYNRLRHFKVLYLAHQYDHGYKALADMDLKTTYGMTIYKKGADVVHTLRFYMGDSLFFPAVRHYLKKYAFSNATIEDLKNALSEYSGINLDDFFKFWIYSKGFMFFEITDFETIDNTGGSYKVAVTIKQRLVEAPEFANSNRVEIYFMDKNFNMTKRIFEFSGETATDTFNVPFEPVSVMPDIYEHIADATIDKYTFVTKPDTYIFDECFFDADVKNISDTAFLRVTTNCIVPENQPKGYLFQKNYYWTIDGIWNDDFNAYGKFYLTTLMDINFTKLFKPEQIILMYRKNGKDEWTQIKATNNGDFLYAPLKKGQYTFAVKR